jgi:hypothetical protein
MALPTSANSPSVMALPASANSPSPVMALPSSWQIVPPGSLPLLSWMRATLVMVLPSATPSIVPLVMALPGPCPHSPTPPPRVCLDTGVSAFPSHTTPFLSHPLPCLPPVQAPLPPSQCTDRAQPVPLLLRATTHIPPRHVFYMVRLSLGVAGGRHRTRGYGPDRHGLNPVRGS